MIADAASFLTAPDTYLKTGSHSWPFNNDFAMLNAGRDRSGGNGAPPPEAASDHYTQNKVMKRQPYANEGFPTGNLHKYYRKAAELAQAHVATKDQTALPTAETASEMIKREPMGGSQPQPKSFADFVLHRVAYNRGPTKKENEFMEKHCPGIVGLISELRTGLALTSVKTLGLIKDFKMVSSNDFYDRLGIDAVVELNPPQDAEEGMRFFLPVQVKRKNSKRSWQAKKDRRVGDNEMKYKGNISSVGLDGEEVQAIYKHLRMGFEPPTQASLLPLKHNIYEFRTEYMHIGNLAFSVLRHIFNVAREDRVIRTKEDFFSFGKVDTVKLLHEQGFLTKHEEFSPEDFN